MALAVSVIMVTYNHERYVEDALRSALTQTYSPLEVIVLDDGSTDRTVERVRTLGDSRVHLFALEHRGIARLSETYNLGLSEARGDLVAILEGDDRWPQDKLARQVPAFLDERVVLSHGPHEIIGARGTLLRERVVLREHLPTGSYDALPHHLVSSYVLAVTAVIRKSALVAAGGFRQLDKTPHWDFPTFLALTELGPFFNAGVVVGSWRKHGSSGTIELAGRDLEGTQLASDLAQATLRRLTARPGLPDERALRRAWADAFGHQALQGGRVLLVNRHFSAARGLALRGLRAARSADLRARLLAVYLAALGHIDLEGMSRRLGRRSAIEELG